MKATPFEPEALAALRAALLAHYDSARRDLPWRGQADPYRVLVSEVMLQQTRVETVVGRYHAWLERFPDLESLASAGEDDVLKAWEGLGYYRRAKNLHRAARVVQGRPDRAVPSTYAELRELPGLGEYTAGAVASIAFGEAVPAADGNARRVLARLLDEPSPQPAWLRSASAALVDVERPGDWNQALMDLGATVCTPRAPRCEACPVARWCSARAAGTQLDRPGRSARRAPREATFALAVLFAGSRVLLAQRPANGLLGGLWAFPEIEISAQDAARAAALSLAPGWGAEIVGEPVALPVIEHRFTHLRASYVPYAVAVARARPRKGGAWIDARRTTRFAVPTAQARVLESFREVVLESEAS